MKNAISKGFIFDLTIIKNSFFFSVFSQYLVLLASSATVADQLEWCGHVESKIRLLIRNLDRNQHITLAHINPKSYPRSDPEPGKVCTMWFIGLVFKKTEKLTVDLTLDIQTFYNLGKFLF